MRRKARPIWWLMALGVAATLGVGVWLYAHQVPTPAKPVRHRAAPEWPYDQTGLLLLDDTVEECTIVANYVVRQAYSKRVSPILAAGFAGVRATTTGIGDALDCSQAFRVAGIPPIPSSVNQKVDDHWSIRFSRIYRNPNRPADAVVFIDFSCPGLCGHGEALWFWKTGRKWTVVKKTDTWEG